MKEYVDHLTPGFGEAWSVDEMMVRSWSGVNGDSTCAVAFFKVISTAPRVLVIKYFNLQILPSKP